MNILFINDRSYPDYTADSLFHGLKNLSGVNVYESTDATAWYMYNTQKAKNRWKKTFEESMGAGFTLFHTLSCERLLESEDEIVRKIEDKFFDKIIYACAWSSLTYFDKVYDSGYSKDDVIYVDGNDSDFVWYPRVDGIKEVAVIGDGFTIRELDWKNTETFSALNFGKYFKREIPWNFYGDVHPISIGFPEELIVEEVLEKEHEWCPLTGTEFPDWVEVSKKRYGFGEQDLFYKEIQKSKYGFTMKKAGWDCLRHYEIIGNGTIPYFHELEKCPPKTLQNFPKELILKTNKQKPKNDYNDVVLELLEYMKNNLTTKKVAEYVLDR
jgi:hypothetical protein